MRNATLRKGILLAPRWGARWYPPNLGFRFAAPQATFLGLFEAWRNASLAANHASHERWRTLPAVDRDGSWREAIIIFFSAL